VTGGSRRAVALGADPEQQAAELLADAEQQAAELLADAEQQAAELLADAERRAAELSADADQQATDLLLAAAERSAGELVADIEPRAAELVAAAKEPAAELLAAAKQRAAELVAAAKQQASERLASAKRQAAELLTAATQQSAGRINALRQGEQEVMEAQKLTGVGQLAAGIAHDFNNLLAVISGYTEILIGRQENVSLELAEIKNAVERAAHLIRQLLAYSRQGVLVPRTVDLNHVVTETKGMLERLIGENIEFSIALAESLGSISADIGQLEQVIVNLVVNARDAMPEGGTLLLETANLTLTGTDGRQGMAPGDYVVLGLTDSGSGMDAETIKRVFEPFYTTKERGIGTGLGLATVFGIVTQSSGHVEVESEPGIGTSFRLYFPQVPAEAEALEPESPEGRPLTGTETILVVEDEQTLRELARRVLEPFGYTVLLGSNGAEGLALAQNYPEPIHLLMTDVLMPKMGGIELAEGLRKARPELKVLYTSGYNGGEESLLMVAGARYIQKPYRIEELAHVLRELLD
jgi:signal transduction histidine kinase